MPPPGSGPGPAPHMSAGSRIELRELVGTTAAAVLVGDRGVLDDLVAWHRNRDAGGRSHEIGSMIDAVLTQLPTGPAAELLRSVAQS